MFGGAQPARDATEEIQLLERGAEGLREHAELAACGLAGRSAAASSAVSQSTASSRMPSRTIGASQAIRAVDAFVAEAIAVGRSRSR